MKQTGYCPCILFCE